MFFTEQYFVCVSLSLSGSVGGLSEPVSRQCNSSQPPSLQSFPSVQWQGCWGEFCYWIYCFFLCI